MYFAGKLVYLIVLPSNQLAINVKLCVQSVLEYELTLEDFQFSLC